MYRRNPGRYAEKETRLFARREISVSTQSSQKFHSVLPLSQPWLANKSFTSFRANIRVSDIAINPGYACTFLTKAMNRWTAGSWYLPRI